MAAGLASLYRRSRAGLDNADHRYGRELPISVGAAFLKHKKVNTFYYLAIGVGVLGFSLVAIPVQFNLLLDDVYAEVYRSVLAERSAA